MRKGFLGEQDLREAKSVAELIVYSLIDAAIIPESEQDSALEFARGKIADRIYSYGEDIRNETRETLSRAAKEAIDAAQ